MGKGTCDPLDPNVIPPPVQFPNYHWQCAPVITGTTHACAMGAAFGYSVCLSGRGDTGGKSGWAVKEEKTLLFIR